jgi:hypothetical protein
MTRNGVRVVGRLVGSCLVLVSSGCHLVVGDFETESGAGGCVEGAFSCDGATLQQCTDQVWVPFQVCSQPELCLATDGRCQECGPGQHRCTGQRLEQCNSTLDGWALVEDCASDLVCDETSASCVTCRAGTARCASDGVTLETCNVNASNWTSDACTAGCVDEVDDCDYCGDCAFEGRWVCSPCGKVLHCVGGAWRVDKDCARVDRCVVDDSGGYCL